MRKPKACLPVLASQTCTIPLLLPAAMRWPSGDHARANTSPAPRGVICERRLPGSYITHPQCLIHAGEGESCAIGRPCQRIYGTIRVPTRNEWSGHRRSPYLYLAVLAPVARRLPSGDQSSAYTWLTRSSATGGAVLVEEKTVLLPHAARVRLRNKRILKIQTKKQPVEKVVLLLSYREKKSSSTREKEYFLTQRSYRSGHS